MGSSETTRVTTNTNLFYSWLAGLIDANGNISVTSNNIPYFEITLASKDIQTLYKIKKTLGFGNIIKRLNTNAYKIRSSKKLHLLNLINNINGLLLTPEKHLQLIKICKFYNINPIIPNTIQSINIIKNTSWLSGFFDIKGHFNIMNQYTLVFHIRLKNIYILDLIHKAFNLGHIIFNITDKNWKYSITDKEDIRYILKFFTQHPLQTIKNIDVFTFKRLLYMIDNEYHFKDSIYKYKIDNLIKLFKNKRQYE